MTTEDTVGDRDQTLASLGVEIWRLGVRLDAADHGRLQDSYKRLKRAFEDLGGRLEDRRGERFVDGMTAEILDQPRGADPGDGGLVWIETIRPGVYLDGKCIVSPQIMLAEAPEGIDDDPATHD